MKHDPDAFRDEILKGLAECQEDFDKATKFLDATGNTQDYHRYAETLFDILISGGLLAPGGEVLGAKTSMSLFESQSDPRQFAQLIQMLLRRYKYMQVSLEEEMSKVLKFIKTFTPENRAKLAKFLAILITQNLVSAKPLDSLSAEASVKEGLSLDFLVLLFRSWLTESQMSHIASALRKEKIDLLEFCPQSKRTLEYFKQHCVQAGGLDELVAWQSSQLSRDHLRQLQKEVAELLRKDTPVEEVATRVREQSQEHGFAEADVVERVFNAAMDAVEWSKKTEQVPEQALRQVKTVLPLLAAFAKSQPAQLALMVRLQTYCYDNAALSKVYHKFIVLLYKAEVVTEDAVLQWYESGHSPKGRSMFLEQMKQMVDWLRNAEEESSEEEEEGGAAGKE